MKRNAQMWEGDLIQGYTFFLFKGLLRYDSGLFNYSGSKNGRPIKKCSRPFHCCCV